MIHRSLLPHPRRHRAFTAVEVLVVIGIIGLLLAILIPTIVSLTKTGEMTKSMSNMKQVAGYLTGYSQDNREAIVPSYFDYRNSAYPGHVRSTVTIGEANTGSWADILWTVNELGQKSQLNVPDTGNDYTTDSPDRVFYQYHSDTITNPFRSAARNTRDADPNSPSMAGAPDGIATPFGTGATELAQPGYFAANGFFNSVTRGWFSHGQIKHPSQAMYLVDSFYGETIVPLCEAYDNRPNEQGIAESIQVDFRYKGACLMLFLDGHSAPVEPWETLNSLEQDQQIRIRNPISLQLPAPCPE